MVQDLDLDETKDIHLDASNDLALTSGKAQLEQSVAIDVMDELQDLVAGKLTGRNIGLLEERIQSGLNDDPQVGNVRNVTIDSFDRQTSIVEISVKLVQNDNFTLNITA